MRSETMDRTAECVELSNGAADALFLSIAMAKVRDEKRYWRSGYGPHRSCSEILVSSDDGFARVHELVATL